MVLMQSWSMRTHPRDRKTKDCGTQCMLVHSRNIRAVGVEEGVDGRYPFLETTLMRSRNGRNNKRPPMENLHIKQGQRNLYAR